MNDFETLINDLTNVRDRMAGTKLDHPWDENVRRNTVARLDAALSDLRVVACRMREDQPCNCDQATDQAVPVENESLRAEVASRTTTTDATVIDRVDGTRTTVRLDGVVMCEHTPITEDLMRRAQVGWVVTLGCGHKGVVNKRDECSFRVDYDTAEKWYYFQDGGRHVDSKGYTIVSLAPPEVVDDVAEVLL